MSANRKGSVSPGHVASPNARCAAHSAAEHLREIDATKRDRFELLSAYLDGEVSPDERRLVVAWLEEDPSAQQLYQRLLHLRRGLDVLCQTPWSDDRAQDVANQVVCRLRQRFRMTCMAGFAAVAVAIVGSLSGTINSSLGGFGSLQTSSSSTLGADGDTLEIALDQPVIPIPKSAVASDNMMERVLRPSSESGSLRIDQEL